MQISDLNLSLAKTDCGSRYKGTYFGEGVNRDFDELEEDVKMVKSGKKYAYIEKIKVEKKDHIKSKYIMKGSFFIWET